MDANTVKLINHAKVLVVGAGGIGCELLKNLVMTGFMDLEVIDLDTIDVSNLNRQFLFRPHHVGKPKAVVAREAVLGFNPKASIIAHHSNIKDPQFGLSYIQRFSLVINALDNVPARRHVNRICLAANVPLIEAGTQGYLGQAFVIKRNVTECFECQPKATQKKYPICTIRSTPDKPVHCVVWAQELYKLLFGDSKSSYLYEGNSASPTEARESVYMHMISPPADSDLAVWARQLFDALFNDEIEKRLSMAADVYKTAAIQPRPLRLEAILEGRIGTETISRNTAAIPDQRVLSLKEAAELLTSSLAQFYREGGIGAHEFSKDSPLDLDFVTAATNLRAYTFGISMQSRFDVKSIAGNIVPAIATTNAIVAGLEVLEAIKILRGNDVISHCRYTYVLRNATQRGKLLLAAKLVKPNPSCYVCGTHCVTLFIDTHRTLLRDFIDKVLISGLAFNQNPSIDNGIDFTFTQLREDETEEEYTQKLGLLDRPLSSLPGSGVTHGITVTVFDETQDTRLSIQIQHRDKDDFDELKYPQFFELVGEAPMTHANNGMPVTPADAEPRRPVAGAKRHRDAIDAAGVDHVAGSSAACDGPHHNHVHGILALNGRKEADQIHQNEIVCLDDDGPVHAAASLLSREPKRPRLEAGVVSQ